MNRNREGDQVELPITLLIKLGSLVVHAQEATGTGASPLDVAALMQLASNPEVTAWLETIDPALLPVKR